MNLVKTRKKVDDLLTDLRAIKKVCKEEQRKLTEAVDYLTYIEEAQQTTQLVAKEIQQKAHRQIARVVTGCLQSIFGDEYAFKIDFQRERGRTSANLTLVKDGNEIRNPINSDSGGVLDIASFGLRLSCVILHKPKLRKLLVLDEPFKFLSVEFRSMVKEMLEKLAKDFGVQIIMVTHIPDLECGKIIRL